MGELAAEEDENIEEEEEVLPLLEEVVDEGAAVT